VPISKPEIHAVVEVAVRTDGIWVELPPEPWPPFVRLCASTSSSDIALLVAVLSSYGHSSGAPAASAQALLDHFPAILPGGLAVVSTDRQIMPSCCCGLETWTEWTRVITLGKSPWTGHDPGPLVEVVGDQIHVWSDGAMGEKPVNETPIVLARTEFVHALEQAGKDLRAFLGPLRRWLGAHAPAQAEKLVGRFEEFFVDL
jgi:hypothetical protein